MTAVVAAVRASFVTLVILAACVPPGNSTPTFTDSGPAVAPPPPAPTFTPSVGVMTAPFEDDFTRPASGAASASASPVLPVLGAPDAAAAGADAAAEGGPAVAAPNSSDLDPTHNLGPNWYATDPRAWRIEVGQLCGQKAHNHGVWLTKTLPINARIEFDAVTDNAEGDLKAEVWGDGHSFAKGTSYNDATSYLVIFGGWKNTIHTIARLDEHKSEGPGSRETIEVDPKSDDPRQRPVVPGQVYHFKIERADGKTVRWMVGDVQMLSYVDPSPLVGMGHDHLAFNDWEVRVCFDNLKITPLP
jgi:hypothetical protein